MGNKGAKPTEFQKTVVNGALEYGLTWLHCWLLIWYMHGIFFHFNPPKEPQC